MRRTNQTTEREPMSLAKKINKVIAAGAIEKDGKMQAAGKYNYHTIDGVVDHLRKQFVINGICMTYTVEDHEKELADSGALVTVKKVAITLTDVDNPEDSVRGVEYGYGIDRQDKGPGKATSYALKTWLTAQFMLKGQPDENDEPVRMDVEKITAKESQALLSEVTEQGIDASKFLKAADANSFDNIPASRLKSLRDMLKQRRKSKDD